MSGSATANAVPLAHPIILPQSREQFDVCFPSEEACLAYVEHLRWNDGFRCPVCGSASCWRTTRGQFRCRRCQHQCSVTSGTLFDGTRKPLRDWLRAIWYVCSRRSGVSALGLMRELNLRSYQTAWVWLHRLRQIMTLDSARLQDVVEADRLTIGGPDDRCFAARWIEPATVAIAVEVDGSGIGRIRLRHIPPDSIEDWMTFLDDAVQPDASLQARIPVQPPFGAVTGLIETGPDAPPLAHVSYVAGMLRRWIRGTYCGAIDARYFEYYLDEFTFRANHRKTASRAQLFHTLLLQAIRTPPDGRLRPPGTQTRSNAGGDRAAAILMLAGKVPEEDLAEAIAGAR